MWTRPESMRTRGAHRAKLKSKNKNKKWSEQKWGSNSVLHTPTVPAAKLRRKKSSEENAACVASRDGLRTEEEYEIAKCTTTTTYVISLCNYMVLDRSLDSVCVCVSVCAARWMNTALIEISVRRNSSNGSLSCVAHAVVDVSEFRILYCVFTFIFLQTFVVTLVGWMDGWPALFRTYSRTYMELSLHRRGG